MDILSTAKEWTDAASTAPASGKAGQGHAEEELTAPQKAAVLLGVFVPFAALVAGIALAWGRGISWLDLGLLGGMYALTVLGVTVGYHRLFTHRAFKATAPVRALLGIAGSMSLQGPLVKWCAIHRRHHQVSDSDGDPHSPHAFGTGPLAVLRGMWHSHVGWIFDADPPDIARSVNDLLGDPWVLWVDRWFFAWFALGLAIPTAIGGLVTGTWWGAFTGFLWGGLVRTCLMHHATWSINSVCHVWGSRPYLSNDHSRNNPIFGVVSFGEGWHNNHHAFPTSARHGLAWWQLDISWLFILALKGTGLAWDVRLPPRAALEAKRRDKPAAASIADPRTGAAVTE